MKIKFKGLKDQNWIIRRGVTFKKGRVVDVEEGEFLDRLLRQDYFTVVKPRTKKNDKISG